MHIILAFLVLQLTIFASASTLDGLILEADSISRDYEARSVILEGNVKVGFDEGQISCDKAVILLNQHTVIASGDVILRNEGSYIVGQKISYNYKTKMGEIEKGFVQSGSVVFSGDLIKQNSQTNFIAKSAQFTSCTTCPAAWSFSGSEIEAEIGGYASVKYPVLRLGGLPVFFLPRIWVPLKSKRESGVLVPSLDYSSLGGTAFSLPYFWAIDRNKDLTYTLKSYEKRGLKHLAEYRYVLTEDSFGQLKGAYLRDRSFTQNGKPTGNTKESFTRGFMTYSHYYELPDNYVQRTSLNLVSDLRYPRDFSDEIEGHGDSSLQNKTSLTRNTSNQHFSIEGIYNTNLLKEDTNDSNTDAVHKAPEINYSAMETEISNTNLFFKYDFNYTNFARRDFSYDDVVANSRRGTATTVRDGVFNYNIAGGQVDQIRTGHRFIFIPTFSYPLRVGHFLDINTSLTYNEAQYRFNLEPVTAIDNYEKNAERRYIQADVSFKTKYSATYGPDDGKSIRYKHEIEPEIIYLTIPHIDKSEHIFFGRDDSLPLYTNNEVISNADFDDLDTGIQFDYRDRLFDRDLATFVLSNFLIKKSYLGSVPNYQKFVTFRVAQSYDLNEAKNSNAKPWSAINALLDIRMRRFETHSIVDHYTYSGIWNSSLRAKYITLMNSYLELTYSNNTIVDNDQNRAANSQRTETWGSGLGFKAKYLDLVGRLNYSLATEQIESWEYLALLKPPGDCWSIKFGHKKTLGSDTNFNFSINFDFAGI